MQHIELQEEAKARVARQKAAVKKQQEKKVADADLKKCKQVMDSVRDKTTSQLKWSVDVSHTTWHNNPNLPQGAQSELWHLCGVCGKRKLKQIYFSFVEMISARQKTFEYKCLIPNCGVYTRYSSDKD